MVKIPSARDIRAQEMFEEGLEITYEATDDDIPASFWLQTEEDFWEGHFKTIVG